MTVKIISRRMDPRRVTIKLVDGSLVQGKVNLNNDEAVIERVSEVFTRLKDPFVVLFDATAEGKSGRILVLNKKNIAWVSPEEEAPGREEMKAGEAGGAGGPGEPGGPGESPRGSWRERLRSP